MKKIYEGVVPMHVRQRRSDESTANAVTRGLNILAVRDAVQARRYMEFKGVPSLVIDRVLGQPEVCRKPTAAQLVSEAITPFPRNVRMPR